MLNGTGLAEAVVVSLDDPHRFASGSAVSSYAGLTPKLIRNMVHQALQAYAAAVDDPLPVEVQIKRELSPMVWSIRCSSSASCRGASHSWPKPRSLRCR